MLAWGAFRLDGRTTHDITGMPRAKLPRLGGRIFFAEWFGAIEAESVLRYDDPVAGLSRAEEALVLSTRRR